MTILTRKYRVVGIDECETIIVDRALNGVEGVVLVVVERRGDVNSYKRVVVTMEDDREYTADHRNLRLAMVEVVKAIKEYAFEIISIEEVEGDNECDDTQKKQLLVVMVVVAGKYRQEYHFECGTPMEEITRDIRASVLKFVDTRHKVFAGMKRSVGAISQQ